MAYIGSFSIFFMVYFIMSLVLNRWGRQKEKKDVRTMANHAFYAGMIYVLALMLFRSFGNLFNK